VLDLLASLVDKSLLHVETRARSGGIVETRFRMLETIREYGQEQLAASEELDVCRRRHAEHYLALVERSEPKLASAVQVEWLDRLEDEHDNLREALRWAIGPGECEVGLRLGSGLGRFWWSRGHWSEGRAWLSELIGLLEAAKPADEGLPPRECPDTRLRAKTSYVTGTLAWWQRDYDAARAHFETSLPIGRENDDVSAVTHALMGRGLVDWSQGNTVAARSRFEASLALLSELGESWVVALGRWLAGITIYDQGDFGLAGRHYEESLARFRRLDDRWGIAQVLNNLGLLANREGNDAMARSLHDQSLAIKRELGDRWGVAQSLNNMGISARGQRDFAAARAYHEEALAIWRDLGDQAGCVWSLHYLGAVALAEADMDAAGTAYRECLVMSNTLGDRAGVSTSLEGLASIAAAQGRAERALRLVAAANGIRAAAGALRSAAASENLERRLASAREALGAMAAREAQAVGRAMSLEDAVVDALDPTEDGHLLIGVDAGPAR
jgi:tetratricopeptide (TPR) repeat protein